MCPGIHKTTSDARRTGRSVTLPVTALQPNMTGRPPLIPPKIMFQELLRFSNKLYTITLSTTPKQIHRNASPFIMKARPSPIADRKSPHRSALVALRRPLGIGRCRVRSIIASMSRSMYEVNTSQPALAAVIATIPSPKTRTSNGCGVLVQAISIVASDVKTRRDTIGGFVTST